MKQTTSVCLFRITCHDFALRIQTDGMDGAIERDVVKRAVAFYVWPCEQDDGFGAVIINGFNALRRFGFQQTDGGARPRIGVLMWLQNREKRRFIRWFRGGSKMPEVLEFLVLWPDRRRIELIRLAETDVFRKEEIRA